VRRDAARRAVERQLADWDAHPVRAQVAQAKDARAIGDADHVDVVVRPIPNHRGEEAAVLAGKVHAPRATELVAEALADDADRRSVHERCDLCDVVGEHAVVQRLVAVVQLLQVHILRDVVVAESAQVEHDAVGLLLQGLHPWRHEATQVESVTLRIVHRHALVPQRVVKNIDALLLRLERLDVTLAALEPLKARNTLLTPLVCGHARNGSRRGARRR